MKTLISEEVLSQWGVYKITNLITGDFYIGSTIESFKKRIFYKHISNYYDWKNYNKRSMCPILYNAFAKYGIENFKAEVLKNFSRKKDSKTNKKIATFLEKRFINKLDPKYNICKYPEIGGCPNLGRKLSNEWKSKIGEKSKLYKHSNNLKVYNKKSQQNKELASFYRVYKDSGEEIIDSFKNLSKLSEFKNLHRWITGKSKSKKGWKVQKIKSQKKRIKIYKENDVLVFNSFGECDRFFNMWRGYTSTQVVNKKDKFLNYKYELLTDKDIV